MARDHARLLVSIWTDDDWTVLDSCTQVTYLSLISSPDLSWCGVAPLLPKRLARHSADLSERKVRSSLARLEESKHLIIDRDTAEILVRTYVRHDGILKQPNVTKALVRALDRVHSDALREAVKVELSRLLTDEPDLKGWPTVQSIAPELFAELHAKGSRNPSGNPLRKVG